MTARLLLLLVLCGTACAGSAPATHLTTRYAVNYDAIRCNPVELVQELNRTRAAIQDLTSQVRILRAQVEFYAWHTRAKWIADKVYLEERRKHENTQGHIDNWDTFMAAVNVRRREEIARRLGGCPPDPYPTKGGPR